jgi:energy-converting hydrogenase Eha subunit C
MLTLSVAVSVAAFLIAYPYAAHFSLAIQIAAHLAIPVCAGFLKLGYVMRLASQEVIQRKRHPALSVPSVAHR